MRTLTIIVALLVLSGCYRKESKTIEVPADACASTYTGRISTQMVTTNTCAAYNKDMQCTINIPNTTTYTYRETVVKCEYTTWR